MPEEATQTADKDIESVVRRFEEAMSSHRQDTETRIASLKRDMEDIAASSRRASEESVAKLQAALDDAAEFISGERKARSEKDRVTESESTLVVPPSDV